MLCSGIDSTCVMVVQEGDRWAAPAARRKFLQKVSVTNAGNDRILHCPHGGRLWDDGARLLARIVVKQRIASGAYVQEGHRHRPS